MAMNNEHAPLFNHDGLRQYDRMQARVRSLCRAVGHGLHQHRKYAIKSRKLIEGKDDLEFAYDMLHEGLAHIDDSKARFLKTKSLGYHLSEVAEDREDASNQHISGLAEFLESIESNLDYGYEYLRDQDYWSASMCFQDVARLRDIYRDIVNEQFDDAASLIEKTSVEIREKIPSKLLAYINEHR